MRMHVAVYYAYEERRWGKEQYWDLCLLGAYLELFPRVLYAWKICIQWCSHAGVR